MIVAYDPDADAAYLRLAAEIVAGSVAKTYPCDSREIGGTINLDFDMKGRLIGIEVLDASRLLPPEVLRSPSGDVI
jgi:uncharacterized protein YuzE